MQVIKKYIKKFRFWLIGLLLTEDESFIILRSIRDRVEIIEKNMVCEKTFDYYNAKQDIREYNSLALLIKNPIWN